jgi:hypothetical protein
LKTTLAIIVTLALAASGANDLLATANSPELSTVEFSQTSDQTRHEGALRPISQSPPR